MIFQPFGGNSRHSEHVTAKKTIKNGIYRDMRRTRIAVVPCVQTIPPPPARPRSISKQSRVASGPASTLHPRRALHLDEYISHFLLQVYCPV